MGEMRNACKVLVGKSEQRRPLWSPAHRWKKNVKLYFREIGCEGVNWIHLAQDRVHLRAVVNTAMKIWIP
jgi:hypothetical protein